MTDAERRLAATVPKLRELAASVTSLPGNCRTDLSDLEEMFGQEWIDYVKSCSPQTILALCDALDAERAKVAMQRTALEWIGHFEDDYLAMLAKGPTTLHIDMAGKARAALAATEPKKE
jgi:hypothetical protein